MAKVKRSEYIIYSRTIIRKLYANGCWGAGSMYEDNLLSAMPDKSIAKEVLRALAKQGLVFEKKKKFGSKCYLNNDRIDKIREIIKEKGRSSIIPLLLMI
jgi:hypothetical protein